MIIRDAEHQVLSTLDGEVIDMTLDENSLVHLMKVMTDLYEDPEMAVLREYATNAWDAHVEAGNPDPIEITLPTTLSPTLVIRDQGVGLNAHSIREVYSKYGASTKRDTDTQIGSLGLGCKSALAYADQFTVQGIKDGILTVVSVSRNSEGAGSMTLVEQSETDEPNGVTIVVPTQRYNEFAEKAQQLFRFWPEGTVLVNGEQPERFRGEQITDSVWVRTNAEIDDYRDATSWVIMGNVPYKASVTDFDLPPDIGLQLVAYVPMGSVHFSPDRESLTLSDLTKRTLTTIGEQLQEKMLKKAKAAVEAAQDPAAALAVAWEWRERLPRSWWPSSWEYKGKPLPLLFKVEQTYSNDWQQFGAFVVPVYSNYRKKTHHRYKTEIPFGVVRDAIWFTGFDKKAFTPYDRRKLDQWQQNNRERHTVEIRHYLLVADPPDATYVRDDRVLEWAEVRATKLPRPSNSRGRVMVGTYEALVVESVANGGVAVPRNIAADDIDRERPVYYYEAHEPKVSRMHRSQTRADLAIPYAEAMGSCTVALFAPTRTAKFLRAFPEARPVQEAVKESFEQWRDNLSDDVRLAWTLRLHQHWELFARLDADRVEDPEIVRAIELARIDVTDVMAQHRRFERVNHSTSGAAWSNPLIHYPLLRTTVDDLEHVYLYLNTAYNNFRKAP